MNIPWEFVTPFLAIVLTIVSYYFGIWIRGYAHVIIPMKDPVSLLLMTAGMTPAIYGLMEPSALWIVTDYRYWSLMLAWWVGYCLGYCRDAADVIYVSVHEIVMREQNTYPIVRYTNPQGQQCWQPQSFPAICKSMIFGIHNPLQLMGVSNPRHIHTKQLLRPRVSVDAFDMAGMEPNTYEVEKFHIKFKVESRKYIPSPQCQDSPYDWIVNNEGYEQMFYELAKKTVESYEQQVNLDVAAMKGAGRVLSVLGGRTPNRSFLHDIGLELDDVMAETVKKRKDAQKKQEAAVKEYNDKSKKRKPKEEDIEDADA